MESDFLKHKGKLVISFVTKAQYKEVCRYELVFYQINFLNALNPPRKLHCVYVLCTLRLDVVGFRFGTSKVWYFWHVVQLVYEFQVSLLPGFPSMEGKSFPLSPLPPLTHPPKKENDHWTFLET